MKTAVFYDLENISISGMKQGGYERMFAYLRQKIESSDIVGEIVLQKAYISKTQSIVPILAPILEKQNIDLIAVEPIVGQQRKKTNMVDFKLNVDVLSIINASCDIDTVVLASGDSDFGFMCQRLKEFGKKLLIISRFEITSGVMFKLCDDWISLRDCQVSPKLVTQIIESRISDDYSGKNFFEAFGSIVQSMESDTLIRRFMSEYGLPLIDFIDIFKRRIKQFPAHIDLGFARLSDFAEFMLISTKFKHMDDNIRYGNVKYFKHKQPLPHDRFASIILNMPQEYTRDKFLQYYDLLDEVDSIDELMIFIGFMKRNGVIKNNKLCNRRNFRAAIRKNLVSIMESAGIVLDKDILDMINKQL